MIDSLIKKYVPVRVMLGSQFLNPALLFILSFLAIILAGTIMLLLPNATHTGISIINALFTATSAVCVTGLIVVDTGKYFTPFGQTIIMVLIQLGGLGIMTITSYFGYFFKGGASYKNQLLLKDMMSISEMAEVFTFLKKIILFTISFELAGAVLIYLFLNGNVMPSISERIFFSIFHAVSGFCNAGFSTLSNSLYESGFRFNYPLHLTIAILFILGGMGFPIIFNGIKYIKYQMTRRLAFFQNYSLEKNIPNIVNVNTRIVLLTTAVLIISGTILFYILEFNNSLSEHNSSGKFIAAFFGAVTPRTAGFNSVDTSSLGISTILLVIILMWIGASPASTGGGIKTSTAAIAFLNIFSIARGKNRIELFGREISIISSQRALAIISLSLSGVIASIFFVSLFDTDKELLAIVFECVSAYSTVGLSLGITGDLSNESKAVIITTMFAGRVGMLTILIAFLRKVIHPKYRYPTEEILIN